MSQGKLFVVATPIGNLQDWSPRARAVIGQVDLVAAEDTRTSRRLLNAFNLNPKMVSLHDHNERDQVRKLLDRIEAGQSIAVISDAGTPLISDPGYRLVAAAHEIGIRVEVVPGASALTAAMSVSGLPSDRFQFVGFPPVKGRKAWLEALRTAEHTLVFFEAPHRIQKLLEEMADIFGADRQAVICRELTKQFEQTVSGSIASLGLSVSSGEIPCKGEFVLVVGGEVKSEGREDPLLDQLIGALKDHVAPSVLADRLSGILGGRKNQVYRKILAAKQDSQS